MNQSWRLFIFFAFLSMAITARAAESGDVKPANAPQPAQPASTPAPTPSATPTPLTGAGTAQVPPPAQQSAATKVAPAPALAPAQAASATASIPIPEITNLDALLKTLNLKVFKGLRFSRRVKIAILDNGFNGYKEALGKTLPADAVYEDGPASAANGIDQTSYHGLMMAQLVHAVLQHSGADLSYDMHLFNSFGITKLESAIKAITDQNFDVVLYSQVWEYGGNGDGKGFIDAMVDKATAAGVIWINAAGNFGRQMRVAPVVSKDGWVDFGKKSPAGVKIYCHAPAGKTCQMRLVLAWNDFKDDIVTGTDKDLDLFFYDSKGKEIASSERNQKLKEDDSDPRSSIIPRELIEGLKLVPGEYLARVKVKSNNFTADKDRLRLTLSGLGMDMGDPSVGETILPPADSAGVIAVGASDDPGTSTSTKLKRPDVYFASQLILKDGSNPYGSSNSAALAAGLTVLHLGLDTERERGAVLKVLKAAGAKPMAAPPVAPPKGIIAGPQAPEAGAAPRVARRIRRPVARTYPTRGRPDGGYGQRAPYGYDEGYPPASEDEDYTPLPEVRQDMGQGGYYGQPMPQAPCNCGGAYPYGY